MVTNFQFIPIDQKAYPHANYFWLLEGKASNQSPYVHAVVPNGFSTLLYICKGSFKSSSSEQTFRQGELVIGGQMDALGRYILEEDFSIFAMCLQPYVIPMLLSIPGESLLNKDTLGSSFEVLARLQNKLGHAASSEDKMKAMIQEFEGMCMRIKRVDASFIELVKEMNDRSPKDLQEVVKKSKLSFRHFQRKFKRFTGFTPIQFLRLARLQHLLDHASAKNLTGLAVRFGYYDQPHFINDFKKITGGITPSQYFAGVEELKWKTIGESVAYFQS